MSTENTEKQTPKWLEDVQQNSYLPELMISGTVIFSLNLLGRDVENLSMSIKQILAMPGGALIYILSSVMLFCAFTSIKWGFITHFLLRAFWVSQIGLSYLFPKGITKEDIAQKPMFSKNLKLDIEENIIKLEKWCSGIFSLMVLFSFIMISVLLFCFITTVSLNIHEGIGFAIITLFLVYLLDYFTFRFFRRFNIIGHLLFYIHSFFKYALLTVVYRNIYYVYLAKIGRLKLNVIFILLLLVGMFSAYPTVAKMQRWPNILDYRDGIVKIDNTQYEDRLKDGEKIPFAAISEYFVKNEFSVFVTYTKRMHVGIQDEIKSDEVNKAVEEHFSLSANKRGVSTGRLNKIQSDILKSKGHLLIDGEKYEDELWVLEENPKTEQLGFRSFIDVSTLDKGYHTISLVSDEGDLLDDHRILFVIAFIKQ